MSGETMMAATPKPYEMVSPGPKVPDVIHVIVEIPQGRRSKFEMDKKTGLIRLDRYLYSSLHYPGDYGFIPRSLAEDGDPLDVLVRVNEPTFSGCLIEARPVGLFKMTDRDDNDYKILAVPNTDPLFVDHHDLWRVQPHYLREVEHFFATYKQLEEAVVRTQGWEPVAAAKDEINACIARYEQKERKTRRRTDAAQAESLDQPSSRSSTRASGDEGGEGNPNGAAPEASKGENASSSASHKRGKS